MALIRKPLAVDLFCGLGGWTAGLLAAGYYVIGFDIERHVYGDERYPAQLVLQNVLTLHGSQFRDAALIVASPPCQFFSYTDMPWSRGKNLAAEVRACPEKTAERLALFNASFRIQREACEAAGRHIPMVVENVRGAQPWVGQARWNFGSFFLWGDVPALMPIVKPRSKRPGEDSIAGRKNDGGSWFNVAHNTTSGVGNNPDGRKVPGFRFDGSKRSFQSAAVAEGRKGAGAGAEWFDGNLCTLSSRSSSRKAASARIAKIPFEVSSWIAKAYFPREVAE